MGRTDALRTRYLIVGNSAGGVGAAEAIRDTNRTGPITVLSEEPYPAYSRPLISEYLSGDRSLREMFLRKPAFYTENGIDCVLGRKAVRLDVENRSLELADGTSIGWERLLLATGGRPIVPKVKGIDKKGVFTFTTLDDAKAMRAQVPPGSTVVVIGGGLIGVSVSQALTRRGNSVVLVELMDRVLSAALDRRASRLVEKRLRDAGIVVITGHAVEEIVGTNGNDGRVAAVILNDGRRIECRAVVAAIGVLPRTELVAGTTLRMNRGIVVDRHMATSCPDVYACGDTAEAHDFLRGEDRLTPIWPNAYMGGRIAGYNMAGLRLAYDGTTNMNSFNYFRLPIISAGIVEPPSDSPCRVVQAPPTRGGTYRRVVLQGNRVVGMVFVGDIQSSGIVLNLMKERIDVRAFQRALVSDGLSLASLPAGLRRTLLARPAPATV
jgi:NAD(P)H-nitrite reductase large subunit